MTKRPVLFAALLITCSSPPPPPNTLPPDPPTFQKVTPVSGGSRVSWHTAAQDDDDWDLTLVARYSGRADGFPGTSVPPRGEAFGSGTVVYTGAEAAFTDNELPADCSRFTYHFWSHDKANHWSGGGVTATTLPGGVPPPAAPPVAFSVTKTATHAVFIWAPATGSASTRVVRNLGTPPLSPEQGETIYSGSDMTTREPLSGLPIGQTLFYAAFACNSCGACSTIGATATLLLEPEDAGIPDAGDDDLDGGSPLRPVMMGAGLPPMGLNVNLAWTNPSPDTGFTQVKVLRQLNALPKGPDDPTAVTVFTGRGPFASEPITRLLPSTTVTPRTYFYVAYGCAGSTCETRGARTTFQLTMSQALHGGGYTIWWRHASASTCGDRTDLGSCHTPVAAALTCQGPPLGQFLQTGPAAANGCCPGYTMNSDGDFCCPSNAPNWWKSCDAVCPAVGTSTATARQLSPPTSTNETQTIHDQFLAKGIAVGRVLSSEMCRGFQTAQGMNFGPTVEHVKALTYFAYDNDANRCTKTYALLNEEPAAGTNTAMVSHAGFSCPQIDSLAWAEGAIFKPNPAGSPTLMTKVAWNQWATLP